MQHFFSQMPIKCRFEQIKSSLRWTHFTHMIRIYCGIDWLGDILFSIFTVQCTCCIEKYVDDIASAWLQFVKSSNFWPFSNSFIELYLETQNFFSHTLLVFFSVSFSFLSFLCQYLSNKLYFMQFNYHKNLHYLIQRFDENEPNCTFNCIKMNRRFQPMLALSS